MAPTHPSSEKSENLRERAVSGTLWYGGTRAVIQVFSWITTIFVARVLTPDDYGLFGMALLYLGFVEVFNQLGFGAAIVQKRDLQDGDLDTIFWMTCGLGLLFYLMTFIAAPWVALFFRQPTLVPVLRIQGLLFILSGLRAVPWNLLTRSVNFKRRSLAEAAANLLASILTVTAAYGGWGVWSLVLGYVARDGAMTAQAYIQVPWRPRWRFHPPTLREVLPYSLNDTASTIGWMT
jgi:PST family polysaccharide transporter